MFGYVMPLKCELKVRELTLYEGWYCGLCKTIGRRYGQNARLVLDYDCTFLALLLSGLTGAPTPLLPTSCALKPFRPKRPIAPQNDALDYAADVNVLLAYHKLKDDWADEKKPQALAGWAAIGAAAKKARSARPKLSAAIAGHIESLSAYERAGESGIDEVADAFASLLKEVLELYPALHENARLAAGWLGYHMGRWIYLADAWEDRARDEKNGAYNPFLRAGADKERAAFLLYASLHEMEKAYDLMDIKSHTGLLDNIVCMGCRQRTRDLLSAGEKTEKHRAKEKAGE